MEMRDPCGEPFRIVVDGIERGLMFLPAGYPDPILQAKPGKVRALDPIDGSLMFLTTWDPDDGAVGVPLLS